MKKIAVYGSLLEGLGNHGIISIDDESTLLSKELVKVPYGMISYGGFPALVPSTSEHNIFMEIYEVSDLTYQRVERLEGFPSFYQKYMAKTTQGEVEVYVINKERRYENQSPNIIVNSGHWKSYKLNKRD